MTALVGVVQRQGSLIERLQELLERLVAAAAATATEGRGLPTPSIRALDAAVRDRFHRLGVAGLLGATGPWQGGPVPERGPSEKCRNLAKSQKFSSRNRSLREEPVSEDGLPGRDRFPNACARGRLSGTVPSRGRRSLRANSAQAAAAVPLLPLLLLLLLLLRTATAACTAAAPAQLMLLLLLLLLQQLAELQLLLLMLLAAAADAAAAAAALLQQLLLAAGAPAAASCWCCCWLQLLQQLLLLAQAAAAAACTAAAVPAHSSSKGCCCCYYCYNQ
uniref:Uncharacterized protein n=1 Tax=Ananas comosus var. bracteatus TaxID=296719 RepID=A0A6V7PR17_ANACO|nr:unnamed protein product [Ananas comosus var. bracteatus]